MSSVALTRLVLAVMQRRPTHAPDCAWLLSKRTLMIRAKDGGPSRRRQACDCGQTRLNVTLAQARAAIAKKGRLRMSTMVEKLEELAKAWIDWAMAAPDGYGLVAARVKDKFVPELCAILANHAKEGDSGGPVGTAGRRSTGYARLATATGAGSTPAGSSFISPAPAAPDAEVRQAIVDVTHATSPEVREFDVKYPSAAPDALRDAREHWELYVDRWNVARRALAPFAELDISHRDGEPDERIVFQIQESKITLGDIRKALAALAPRKEGE